MTRCPEDLVVARWVDGELSENDAHALSAHAATCAMCRSRAAHLRALTRLPVIVPDPSFAGEVVARLDGWDPKHRRWPFVVGALVAMGLVAVIAWPRASEWSARGGGDGDALEVSLRREPSGVTARVIDHARAPTWLMIFGLDRDCEVHWLLPAWDDASADPVGRRFAGEAPLVDLPEGLRAPPGPFTVVTAQSDRAVSVRTVEATLGRCHIDQLALLGLRTTTTALEGPR